jgi:cyclopropane fatty-acyl-phospholipid synthase-like methyltransferase
LTLSIEQKQLAEKRIEEAGFSGQIRVHFMDYRDMPAYFKGAFDACVSLEMLEVSGSMEGVGKCSTKLRLGGRTGIHAHVFRQD